MAARVNILEELGKWDWEVTHGACGRSATVTEPELAWEQHLQETLFDFGRQSASAEVE